jgi:hypothetical protein
MELVGQLTPFTCVLACLESFFKDVDSSHDQCSMLRDYSSILHVAEKHDEYGTVVGDDRLRALVDKLGFYCAPRLYANQVDLDGFWSSLKSNEAVLIMARWKKESDHCVRFSRITEKGEYEVMNPAFLHPKFENVTYQELVDWNFRIFYVFPK